MPFLMVGDPVPCCLGRANGEKVKDESIMEFSKLKCEVEQATLKPTKILWGRHVSHRTIILCWGYSCLSLVAEFSSCTEAKNSRDYPHASYPKVHSVVLFCQRCQVHLAHCLVSASFCGVLGVVGFLVWVEGFVFG